MIWICTVLLLVVSAWLFFNALNERRWVQAHSHDESVASDEGFLPSFTARTGSGILGADGKVSISQENSTFGRAVSKLQEKTANFGDKFLESKVSAARIDDPEQRPKSASEENTLFGRAVARVSDNAERMDQKIVAKMKTATSKMPSVPTSTGELESLVERTARKVSDKSEDVGHLIANRAKNIAQGVGGYISESDKNSVLGKVSGGMGKIGAKVASARSSKTNTDEDLITRIASKVGNKINEMDGKIATAGKKAASKLDKS